MYIKILRKKYQCNKAKEPNDVYFEVDGEPLAMKIFYVPDKRKNYFVESKENMELKEYIMEHYDIDWEKFLGAFFNELRIYSRYRNLNPVTHFNVSDIKYH